MPEVPLRTTERVFSITVTLDLLYNLDNNILFILYKVREGLV